MTSTTMSAEKITPGHGFAFDTDGRSEYVIFVWNSNNWCSHDGATDKYV